MAAKRKTKRNLKLDAKNVRQELEKLVGKPLRPFKPHVWVRPKVRLVELCLEDVSYFADWIKGEGGDIALLRANDRTERVVGAVLPLRLADREFLLVHEDDDLTEKIPKWRNPPVDIPVQKLREFIAQYGPDVSVLVTWHHDGAYQFVTIGSEQDYSDAAVRLRNKLAEFLELEPLGPTKEDLRGDHPNVSLDDKQLTFLLWMLGRTAGERDKLTNRHKAYINLHHDALLEKLGAAREKLAKRPT